MSSKTLFVVATVALANPLYASPVQWRIEDGGNGHFYEAVLNESGTTGITWDDANLSALAQGRQLASITSAAENDFIFSLIDDLVFFPNFAPGSPGLAGPWIGGVQAPGAEEPDGGWGWTTGEPFVFENWLPGIEPNDSPPNEDRIHFESLRIPGNTWNDLVGADARPVAYITEWVIPEPSSVSLIGVAALLVGRMRRQCKHYLWPLTLESDGC